MRFALVALCGCSFLSVSGPDTPDPTHAYSKLDCDEGNGPPIIDSLVVAGATAGTIVTAVSDDPKVALFPAAVVVAFAASAYYGIYETQKCRRLHQEAALYGIPGHEGMACSPTAGCDPDLVCASSLCVRLPPGLDGGVP
jgi:hypothetical protein